MSTPRTGAPGSSSGTDHRQDDPERDVTGPASSPGVDSLPDFLAVLALVDTLQGENERLREALIDLTCQAQKEIMLADGYPGDLIGSVDRALSVLSVPPAKKKQP